MQDLTISIVVPAYNAAADIEHFLASLLPQLTERDECIIVDDGSRDRTKELVRAAGVRLIELERNSGPAAARNHGAAHASGEILLFLDSDVVPDGGLLELVRAHFAEPGHAPAVMGSYDDKPLGQTTVSRFRNLLHCYTHHTGNREASTFWTGCGAMRKDLFHEMGGFAAEQFGIPSIEDVDLGIRVRQAGHRILLNPDLQVQHRKIWTWASMIRTDVFHRAVPWSKLMLGGTNLPADLNFKPEQRLCAIAVVLATGLLPLLFWVPLWAGLGIALLLGYVTAVNWPFYRFLARRGGWGFAIRSMPAHWVYYWSGVIGMGLAFVSHAREKWFRRSRDRQPASES